MECNRADAKTICKGKKQLLHAFYFLGSAISRGEDILKEYKWPSEQTLGQASDTQVTKRSCVRELREDRSPERIQCKNIKEKDVR